MMQEKFFIKNFMFTIFNCNNGFSLGLGINTIKICEINNNSLSLKNKESRSSSDHACSFGKTAKLLGLPWASCKMMSFLSYDRYNSGTITITQLEHSFMCYEICFLLSRKYSII